MKRKNNLKSLWYNQAMIIPETFQDHPNTHPLFFLGWNFSSIIPYPVSPAPDLNPGI